MSITPLSTDLDHVQALNDRPNANSGMTADQVKETFDQAGNDIKDYINDSMIPNINTTFVSNASLATDRKLSATGDFTGTLNGYPIIASDPGLVATVTALQDNVTQRSINVCFPPTPYAAVVGNGVDALSDTNRLQAIVDYAIANKFDVYCPINLILQPILQADGSLVCIKFDDGLAATGNTRKPFKFIAKKGAVISTNNTTASHTVFRWKLGDSILDGFSFSGTRAYTKAIEISRISLTATTEVDTTTRNKFTNLRFVTCNRAITLEGSAYYNTFENITFYSCNRCLWLKRSYALINALNTFDSSPNRNNFLNMSAYACTDGVLLDYGDTNKFYNLSFEGCTTAVQVYDQVATYPLLQQTIYNSFYGVTNEANTTNLIYNAPYGNSFYDFESPYTKVTLTTQPLVFIPSGDAANNHLFLQRMVQTNDSSVLAFSKNRDYSTSAFAFYAHDFADYTNTLGTDSLYKLYDWRDYNFTAGDCTNVASRIFNGSTRHAVYKSIGGIVYYYAKFSFIPTTNSAQIKIPLPTDFTVESDIYGFNNNIEGVVSVGYRKDGGTPQIIPAIISGLNLVIPVPTTGNWSTTAGNSANVIMVNLHFVRTMPPFRDLN